MVTSEMAETNDSIDWKAADKCARYTIEVDRGQSIIVDGEAIRLSVRFSKRESPNEEPHWIVFSNLACAGGNPRFEGPGWKRSHTQYYVRAFWLLVARNQGQMPVVNGETLVTIPFPAPAAAPSQDNYPRYYPEDLAPAAAAVPLPPRGKRCPTCGSVCKYVCAWVGGRGTCWRNVCPNSAEDIGTCSYIEAWNS